MSRRTRPAKRITPADSRYHSPVVQEFINRMMYDGKKSVATGVMYDTLEDFYLAEALEYLHACLAMQSGQRLIEQQDARLRKQGAADCHALALAA